MATPTYKDVLQLTRDAQAMGLYDASPEFLASMLGISPKEFSAILASQGRDTPVEAPPASKELTPTDVGGAGKGEAGIGRENASYGPMSSQLSGTLSNLSNVASIASTLGPALGIGALASLGPIGTVLGYGPLASTIASMFGVQPGFDPTLTDIDVQGVRDYSGAFAAEGAAQRNAANRSMKEAAEVDAARAQAEAAMSPEGSRSLGQAMGKPGALDPSIFGGPPDPSGLRGPGDPSQAESAASKSEAASGFSGGIMGGETTGGGPGGTSGGQSEGGYGGSGSGEGGPLKEGGVRRVTKETRFTVGEPGTGGETLIAVPQNMKMNKKGKGKKKEVMRGLAQELKELGKGSYLEELMSEALGFLGEK